MLVVGLKSYASIMGLVNEQVDEKYIRVDKRYTV